MLPIQILLNNFPYDLAQISIPTDRDIRSFRRFMWFAGPISSAYDFLTFFILLRVFDFGAAAFHTGWFVESLATQTLVLLVIRTAARPWRDRPSWPLIATTLAVFVAGIALPFTRVARVLGFEPLRASYFAFLAVVVVSYLAVVELVKARAFGCAARVERHRHRSGALIRDLRALAMVPDARFAK